MGMDLCHSFSCSHDKVKSEVRKSSLVTGLQNYVSKLAMNYLKMLCISGHIRYFIMWYGWCNDTLAMCAASWGIIENIQENILALLWSNSSFWGFFLVKIMASIPSMFSCSLTLLWKHSFGLENNQFYSEETHFCKNVGEVWTTEHLSFCSSFFTF